MRIPEDIDWDQYLSAMSFLEASVIHWGSKWEDELLNELEHGSQPWGEMLPWSKTHGVFRFRPGELTVWAGYNGHRKSMLVGQVMLWLAKESRICIASLEMKPFQTMKRVCMQAAGCYPSKAFGSQFAKWTNDRICIYDQLDTVEQSRIFALIYYASRELGCGHVVIDSLTKCGLPDDDHTAEKKFVDRLQWLAKSLGVHIHLICHMRKGESEGKIPNKFDIKGSGSITDLPDNVMICWKNKRKEQALKKQKAGQALKPEEQDALEREDQALICEKQRHGDWEGAIKLWFHQPSLQFIASDHEGAMPFSLDSVKERPPIVAPGWEIYGD